MRVLLIEKSLNHSPSGPWHVSGAMTRSGDGPPSWVPGFVDSDYSAPNTPEGLWNYLEDSGGNGYTTLVEVRPVESLEKAVELVADLDKTLRVVGHPLGAFNATPDVAGPAGERPEDTVDKVVDPCAKHVHIDVPLAVADVLSWQLLAQLVRRHPHELWLLRTYPMDGNYDCLSVRRLDRPLLGGSSIALNRRGSHVLVGALGEPVTLLAGEDLMSWGDPLAADDPHEWLVELERRSGLTRNAGSLPASTGSSLTIRWIAEFLTISMSARHRWTAWTIDDPGGQIDELEAFPEVTRWCEARNEGYYKIWLVGHANDRKPMWVLSSAGDLWGLDGAHCSLLEKHKPGGSIAALVLRTIGAQ